MRWDIRCGNEKEHNKTKVMDEKERTKTEAMDTRPMQKFNNPKLTEEEKKNFHRQTRMDGPNEITFTQAQH